MSGTVLVVIWTTFVGQTTYNTYHMKSGESCEGLKARVTQLFTTQERKVEFIGCVLEGETY